MSKTFGIIVMSVFVILQSMSDSYDISYEA